MSENKNYNPYTDHGYLNRRDYLKSLSEEYGIDLYTVSEISDMLGESEDFDGLVNALQDYEMEFCN